MILIRRINKERNVDVLNELGITREDILDRAAERLIETLSDIDDDMVASVRKKVVADVFAKVSAKASTLLEGVVSDLVDSPFTPVDEWGEPKIKKPTTLRQMIKEKSIGYLSEKVDGEGKASTYNAQQTRADWLAKKAAKESIDHEVKAEITKAVDAAKAEVRTQVAKFVADTILKR
jgi:hypothetical protein